MNRLLKISAALGLIIFNITYAATPIPWPTDLYDRLRERAGNEWDEAGAELHSSLFESLSDLSLLETKLGPVEVELGVERKVYKNYDLLNSYTVIDFMKVPMSWPVPLGDAINVGASALQFQLGLTISPELMNIRQVLPKDLETLEDSTKLTLGLKGEVAKLNNSESDDQSLLGPIGEIFPWNSDNPLTRARYYKFWNLFTGPLKLPLSATKFKHDLSIGEIISYSLKGRVQLGASVGWSAIKIPGVDSVTPGVGISTFLDGSHRISVMREDEEHALVKLTRTRSHGNNASLGATRGKHVLFEGVVVLGARIGEIDADVIPFSFNMLDSDFETFDVTYRYDLSTPEGEQAFNQAVFGRFAKSDEFSHEAMGVEKVVTRNQTGHATAKNHRMVLSFLAERSHTVSESTLVAHVTLQNGEQIKLHRAISSNVRVRDTILGHKEVKSYTFKATLDEDLYASGDQGLVLRLEGKIEDSRTRATELYRYMEEMETLAGQPQFFPRPPKYRPCNQSLNEDCNQKQIARYKGTSFYFRLGLTRKQVERFIATPKEKMWAVLERAFEVEKGKWSSFWSRAWYGTIRSPLLATNLPLGILDLHIKSGSKLVRAKSFRSDWLELQELYFSKNRESELVSKLTSLFTSHYFSYELARVLRVVLEDEPVSYYLAGNASRLFGHLSRSGTELDRLDARYEAIDDVINFDSISGRNLVDQNYQVKELKVEHTDEDTFTITFELPEVPDFLYVNLARTSNWKPYKELVKFIVANQFGELKKGANTIVVERNSDGGVAGELAEVLFKLEDDWVTLSLALGKDSKWGALSDYRFRTELE